MVVIQQQRSWWASIRGLLYIKLKHVMIVAAFGLLLLFGIWMQYDWMPQQTLVGANGGTKNDVWEEVSMDQLHAQWEGCTVGPIPQPKEPSLSQEKNKPFWAPRYPDSDHGVLQELVVGLTGWKDAVRNYHASSPTLVRCFTSTSITVLCEQIHPIVDLGKMPQKMKSQFQSTSIVLLRNPMTAIPQHFQAKAEMYHGVSGQETIDAWRKFRDTWVEKSAVTGWSSIINAWKNMTDYNGIGLYIPFEDVLDPVQGPILTSQLASMLQTAGFPTVLPSNKKDITCVWYQSIKDLLKPGVNPHYKYATYYIPEYTVSQKSYMVQQLQQLQRLYPKDTTLTAILNQYIYTIENNAVNDIPAASAT